MQKKLTDKPILPIIAGPTASGKTELSINFSSYLVNNDIFGRVEFISADSRQLYKHLDIGTAKADKSILQKNKHHFVDILELDEEYSSGKFGEEANNIVSKILKENKSLPIVVGGTGFYISSMINGIGTGLPRDQNLKDTINDKYKNASKDYLFDVVKTIDPVSAELYSDKNPVRLLRVIEYHEQTGERLSEATAKPKELPYFPLYILPIVINDDKERVKLYERINERCDFIWENGLLAETENALKRLKLNIDDIKLENDKLSNLPNSLNTVGYKEAILHLKGLDKHEAIELFKRNTRRYAKRQITWFRRVQKENSGSTKVIDFQDKNNLKVIAGLLQL
jgi:tRNA dimethylallyltransferase